MSKKASAEMGVSLSKVLKAEVFRNHQLYAGEAGLDRLVHRITISDIPDALDWLVGGEIVCTTGYNLTSDSAAQEQWMRKAASKGAVAIIIKPERFLGEVTQCMIDVANELALPLIGVPNDVIWPSIIQGTMDILFSEQFKPLQDVTRIHHQLEKAVLSSSGLQKLLDTMSEIVGCFVVLTDRNFNLVEASSLNVAEKTVRIAAREALTEHVNSLYPELKQSLENRKRLTSGEVNKSGITQVFVPVIANDFNFGWLCAYPVPPDQHNFVQITMEHGATLCALELMGRFSGIQTRTEQINRFFSEMLSARSLSHDEILRYGREWGVNLNKPSILIRVNCTPQPSINSFRFCVDILKQADADGVISQDGTTVNILYHPKASADGEVREECKRLCYRILSSFEKGIYSCNVGVSSLFSIFDISQFRHSYYEAEICVNKAIETQSVILFGTDVGVAQVFSYIEDFAGFEKLAERTLAPLNSCDSTLVATLVSYMNNGFNKKKTADALAVHVNTVSYRLQKIREILGHDDDDISSYILMYLAANAIDYREKRINRKKQTYQSHL